jgi:putative tryptophan/tyrosine transport system substrate-binding protein
MRRRKFITLVGSAAGTWSLAAAGAQQLGWVRRIAVLMGFAGSDPAAQSWLAAFRDALAKLGWKGGSNFQIEIRWGAGDANKIRASAKELVDLRPDAIFSQTTPAITVLARETQTIPIVFVLVCDPIGSGFAASLAHPVGNATGMNPVSIGKPYVQRR